MNDIAVRADRLSKTYRLYKSPGQRLLDTFGWAPRGFISYSEHHALHDITFEVAKGEKVGIIGRNGAGKSTLLKLITRSIDPTSGTLEVEGTTQALLQIGTGFHPDFTGRDNILTYLAQLGIAGERARALSAEIVEFAEVEEYIDQPVKTYSTGMAARLMFAASTVIDPDLLVIDEVLGVGDAYFARKSYERIRTLCDTHGSTLLLVSHDVYSASQICDRMIWIDRGRIRFDGEPKETINLYEASIKEQEERRLAKRNRELALNLSRSASDAVSGYLKPVDGDRPGADFAVGEVTVHYGDEVISADPVLDPEVGNWGEMELFAGCPGRAFRRYGSPFRKLGFLAPLKNAPSAGEPSPRLQIEVYSEGPIDLVAGLTDPVSDQDFASALRHSGSGWETLTAKEFGLEISEQQPADRSRYGTRHLEILDLNILDRNGNEVHAIETLQPITARLRFRINDPDFDERPVFVFAFQKDGVLRTHRFATRDIVVRSSGSTEQTVEAHADPLLLGAGDYTVTVSIFREGYFDGKNSGKFFSVNEGVIDMKARCYEFTILQNRNNPLLNDVVFEHPAGWSQYDAIVPIDNKKENAL